MTIQARRLLIVIGIAVIAGLLAFPLRETIYQMIVIPVAFIAWRLNLLYRSFSQGIWWWVIVFIVLLMLAFSLMPQPKFRQGSKVKSKPQLGQVQSLAVWLHKAEGGIYFKWLIANRLGKLAYQILLHRETGRPRSVFAPLLGLDWEPTKELREYLETGLHGSFADFPVGERSLGALQSPLDFEVVKAVEFLESQVENGHLPQSPKGDH